MDINIFKYITLGLYAVGVKDRQNDRFCGLIVDALMPFIPDPTTIVVSVRSGCYSCEKMMQEKRFSVCALGQNTSPAVFANLGYQTGRTCDKWQGLKYFAEDDLPYLSDALYAMTAKVTAYYQVGDYTLFIARIEGGKQLNEGQPLTYAEYQNNLKSQVIDLFNNKKKGSIMTEQTNEKWVCKVCGYVYEGEIPFEQLPEEWTCPLCGVGKDQFEKVAE